MKGKALPILVLIMIMIINSEASAQNSAASDFKPSGNVWGMVFGDYYWKQHSDSAGRGGKNVQYSPTVSNAPGINGVAGSTGANAFQIRRAYLGYDYNITAKISASLVLANEQNLDASGNNTTYLKFMYVKYTDIFPNSNLLIGQMSTPSFSMPFGTDGLWGYRSIERTIMDVHAIDASCDFGAALQGSLWQGKTANDTIKPILLGYAIMVGNGNSAKPETDIFKKFRGTIYASLLQQKLTFGFYADYNRTALATSSIPRQESKTLKAYIYYKTRVFRIGAEAFQQENANSDEYVGLNSEKVQSNIWANGIQQGVSVFLSGKILPKLNFYARVDLYDPDTKFNSAYQNNYLATYYSTPGTPLTDKTIKANTSSYTQIFSVAGLDYTITKRVHIMPNIWYNHYESKLTNVSHKEKSDYDLVPRITFYVIFNNAKNISGNGMDN